MNRVAAIILVLGVLANAGCESLRYYGQAVAGHTRVLAGGRDIDRLIEKQAVSGELAARLERVREMRRFAVEKLGLPDNRSYRRYTVLDREHVVWNVFAAPEFSIQPLTWCFPVVGCVAYRGYYARSAAERFAERLVNQGNDVFVAGIDAYSTLGYLPDPVLSSFIDYPEAELAALLFHELAHQLIHVADDTAFNESFATTVERNGVKLWLDRNGDRASLENYRRRREYSTAVTMLMLGYRQRLQTLYDSGLEDTALAIGKTRILDALYRQYVELGGRHGMDREHMGFSREDMNNALLSSFDLYHRWVPAFQWLLDRNAGELGAFYAAVGGLAGMTPESRRETMERMMKNAREES